MTGCKICKGGHRTQDHENFEVLKPKKRKKYRVSKKLRKELCT
jgi:hypothetical protein